MLRERAREWNLPLWIATLDFKKAIDTPSVIALLAKYDMVVNYKNTEDYRKFVAETIASETKAVETLGLGKKKN